MMDDILHESQHAMISHMAQNQTKAVRLLQGIAIGLDSLERRVARVERYIAVKQRIPR
jgi:hypothetical protein